MSIPLVVGDFLEWTIVTHLNDQVGINVFHARVAAPLGGTPNDVDTLSGLDNLAAPIWKALMCTPTIYRGSMLRIIRAGAPFAPVVYTGNSGTGTFAGSPGPSQARGLISWQTAFAGRSYRGRTYLPFPGQGANTADGLPNNGYLGALSAVITMITTNPLVITASGQTTRLIFGIYHRRAPKPPATTPLAGTMTDIVAGRRSLQWATQMRSGSYGRPNPLPF
jgi:hypothetical protein